MTEPRLDLDLLFASGHRDAISLDLTRGDTLTVTDDTLTATLSYHFDLNTIAQKEAADASADWYEHFPEHMELAPREFAWSYIQRSGRIDPEKLRKIAPKFVAG
mgnify:CR=1 FL=1